MLWLTLDIQWLPLRPGGQHDHEEYGIRFCPIRANDLGDTNSKTILLMFTSRLGVKL